MGILLTAETRILLQGVTDSLGRFQCAEMLRYGSALVGIVEPDIAAAAEDLPRPLPAFTTFSEAVAATDANLAVVFTPGLATYRAVSDAFHAGIGTVICFSENVPLHDILTLRHEAARVNAILVGPSSSGVYSPKYGKAGFFCKELCIPGRVGVVAKSGSLGYAVLCEMTSAGIGISTVVSVGGEAVKGMGLLEPVKLFEADPETDAIVVLGEIGGGEEEEVARYVSDHVRKPVVAFIAGRSVRSGQSLGHAGAIVARNRGSYEAKARALTEAGVHVADDLGEIAEFLGKLGKTTA